MDMITISMLIIVMSAVVSGVDNGFNNCGADEKKQHHVDRCFTESIWIVYCFGMKTRVLCTQFHSIECLHKFLKTV